MSRTTFAALVLGALVAVLQAAPGPGLTPRASAASCSGWSSNTEPPPSIRVFRHATGAVETVNFRPYLKNVLSREWIASWTTESLRSGALAVRNYAWYQVLHWRGGTNADGDCFDIRDDTYDQVYDPSKPTYSTAAAAVDDTWAMLVHKDGAIFPTYYNAGVSGERCGANANGWKAYQWGTQACGLAGKSAAQIILTYYYPDVTVSDGGPPDATPTPSPTPRPTATPKPSPTGSVSPSRSPGPTPAPPSPTPRPTPAPTADPPLATPPPDQQLPGGGQQPIVGAAAPPPPPPASPTPVVAAPMAEARVTGVVRASASGEDDPRWAAALRRADELDRRWSVDGSADTAAAQRPQWTDPRLAAFRQLWADALAELVAAVTGDHPALAAVAGGATAAR